MAIIKIREGDSLSKIAQRQNTTVAELAKLNPNIKDVNLIFAGSDLTIPDDPSLTPGIAPAAPSPQQQVTGETKTVKPVETEPAIDRKTALTTFGASLNEMLKQFQGLDKIGLQKKKDALRIAQTERISEITPETLRTLSPSAQARIRSGQEQALSPTIESVSQLQVSITSFESLLNTAREFGKDFVKSLPIPQEVLDGYKQGIESGQIDITSVPIEVRGQVAGIVDFTAIQEDKTVLLQRQKLEAEIKLLPLERQKIEAGIALTNARRAEILNDISDIPEGELSPEAIQILNNPSLLESYTPTRRGEILDEIARGGAQAQTVSQKSTLNMVNNALDTLNRLDDNARGLARSTGFIRTRMLPLVGGFFAAGTSGEEFTADLTTFVDQLTLPNLEFARGLGRMSREQFRALRNASTNLSSHVEGDLVLSRDAVERELKSSRATLETIRDRMELEGPASIPSDIPGEDYEIYIQLIGK